MIPEIRGTGVGGTQTMLDVAARSTVEQRTIQNLPLPRVDMAVPIDPADLEPGKPWPPARFKPRQARLKILRDLWEGDWSHFVADPMATRVSINYFARLPEVLAAMLSASGLPDDITDPVMTAIHEMCIGGRCHTVALGDTRFTPRNEHCFVTQDGSTLYVVTPEVTVDSSDGRPDILVISAIGQGGAETWTSEWDAGDGDGRIGDSTSAITSTGQWGTGDRPPVEHGQWGRSLLQPLIGPVLAISLRFTGNEDVLSKWQRAPMWINGSLNDTVSALSTDGDDDIDTWGRAAVQQAMQRIPDQDVIWQEADALKPEFVSPEIDLTGAALQIELLKAELRMLTGLVAALEHEGGDVASGTAQRMMRLDEELAALQIQDRVHAAAEQAWGAFDWPPAFQAIEEPEPDDDVDQPDDVDPDPEEAE